MKHSLEHLPARKQRHLDMIVKVIRAAVDVEMIILYGSHARGDWIEGCGQERLVRREC